MKAKAILAVAIATLSLSAAAQTVQPWMSSDVGAAWAAGYKGQGATITVVDDYTSATKLTGTWGLGTKTQQHGFWTSSEAAMIAPSATVKQVNFGTAAVALAPKGLNVINMSYGIFTTQSYMPYLKYNAEETSIINYAKNGQAVVVKAAGNDGVATGTNLKGTTVVDSLAVNLKGAQSVIYAGALQYNGTTAKQSLMASYSNTAGTDAAIQSRFLVVGVDYANTKLAGTSFAAPIISGYAAVLGSKFTTATPTAIVNQLLNTARTDTLKNYNAATYGRGEASLSRALAPVAIK